MAVCSGMIDPHVHLRDWEEAHKETLAHGMQSGEIAGFSVLFDMPNTSPPLVDEAAVKKRLADADAVLAQRGAMYYGVYGGLTGDAGQRQRMVRLCQACDRVVGLKMFCGHSTGAMGITSLRDQRAVYTQLVALGYTGLLALHCEKEDCLHPECENPADYSSHSLARPVESEVASIRDQLTLACDAGFAGTLHICHISSAAGLAEVARIKKGGLPFTLTLGATAHHALLTQKDARIAPRFLKMNPPLRDESDRAAIFQALLDGTMDWIESDHAPHSLADKKFGACGISGFTGTLLLIRQLRQQRCSEEQLRLLLGGAVLRHLFVPVPIQIVVPNPSEIARMLKPLRARYEWDPWAGA